MVGLFKDFLRKRRHRVAGAQANKFLTQKVQGLMTPYVVTMKPDVSVVQAATRMVAQNISCVVVVDVDDPHKVKGIITERDFIMKVPASASALKKKVGDIMSNKIVAVSPDDSLRDAFGVMRKHGIRKLVVMHEDRLVGIVTQTDIVNAGLKILDFYASTKPLVRDWMTKAIVSVRPNASFAEAKKLMIKKDIGALLVKGASYEGIFTEYDIVAQFYDQGGMLRIQSPKHIMHEHIRCISAESTLMFANRVMAEKKVRRLLVVGNAQPVGLITQTDVAKAIVASAEDMCKPEFMEKQKVLHKRTKNPITSTYVSENLKVYGL